MRFPFNPRILPRLSLWLGIVGLGLRIWLFATGLDRKGLLETGHPANALAFVLTAVCLLLLATSVQPLSAVNKYAKLFPASPRRALGTVLGSVGFLYAGIFMHGPWNNALPVILLLLGLLATAALVGTGFCRLKGLRPSFLLCCVVTFYMLLHTVSLCRDWGSVPQVQQYFFPLLANIFLLLTCYQYSLLNLQKGSRRQFAFCNQAALFFCLLSATEHAVFYLCMSVWMALDLCSLRLPRIGKFLPKGKNES